MKKAVLGLCTIACILFMGMSDGPGNFFCAIATNAPGEGTCLTCHSDGGLYTGEVEIGIVGNPSSIEPNTLYDISVTLTATSGDPASAGFQIVALEDNGGTHTNAGTWSPGGNTEIFDPANPTNTGGCSQNGRIYIENVLPVNFPSNSFTWNFSWTSPATATGDITFYSGGLLANGSGTANDSYFSTDNGPVPFAGGAPLTISLSNIQDASCHDSFDGSAMIEAFGGSGTYTYNWDNGENTSTATELNSGTHSVTVSDGGTDIIEFVNIGAPSELFLNVILQSDVICNGDNSGFAEVSASGGNSGYSYAWSNGANGAIQNNLPFGEYNVTTTDSEGCMESEVVFIDEPSVIDVNVIDVMEPSCFGESDGGITVEANGGNGGFQYNWIFNGTVISSGASISFISKGTYVIQVIDSENCENEFEIILEEPTELTNTITGTNVNCLDGEDGVAIITVDGGAGGYNYLWSNGATTQTITNLSAGTYSVTTTDASSCEVFDAIIIEQPLTGIEAQINQNIQPSCDSSNGELVAVGEGGNPAYTYLWGDGSMGMTLSNIPSGVYLVTISDLQGCEAFAEFILSEIEGVSLSPGDVANNNCYGSSDGAASVDATGGSGVYSYSWSNGSTDESQSNLPAGSYVVTVSDDNNCSSTISIEITQPDLLMTNETIVDVQCNGDENGEININPTGGEGNISVLWSNGSEEQNLQNIVSGSYSVTLTDGNSCEQISEYMVSQPDLLIIESSIIEPSCSASTDGSLMVSPSGGTGDISILWSTGSTDMILNGLGAGTYSVSITDENNCSMEQELVLEDPLAILANVEVISESAVGEEDGSATASPENGQEPYQYSWSNGEITKSIDGLAPGMYTVTITDANGCTATQTVIVNNGDCSLMVSETSVSDISCYGESNGSISIVVEGLQDPTTYIWNDGQEGSLIEGLDAGLYSVIITDANNCEILVSGIEIVEPTEIVGSDPILSPASNESGQDGQIDISFSGGQGDLQVEVTDGLGNDIGNPALDALTAGTFLINVTDENGCAKVFGPFIIDVISSVNELFKLTKIYPIPVKETILIADSPDLSTLPVLYSSSGEKVAVGVQKGLFLYSIDVNELNSGVYFLKLVSNQGTVYNKVMISK